MTLQSSRFAGNQRVQSAARNEPPMRMGERDEAVAILQQALVDLGYPMPVTTANNREPPDAIYGSETRKTVWQFQRDHNLSKDGVAGHDTFHKLDELFAKKPTTPGNVPPPIIPPPPPPRPRPKRETLTVLAYNAFMRVEILFNDGQEERARLIPRHLRGFDVIIFSELFDNSVRGLLLGGLTSHPFKTSVVGEDSFPQQDGGVVIASKWPIWAEEERLYGRVYSPNEGDAFAQKGVKYACISKNGRHYHIFGTHTDAGNMAGDRTARRSQFILIDEFIFRLRIPRDEPVIVGGDLNVNRYNMEYIEMLRRLRCSYPSVQLGNRFTYDPQLNDLAEGDRPEYLDYVLARRHHRQPVRSSLTTLIFRQRWDDDHEDLSDHYGVAGYFEYER